MNDNSSFQKHIENIAKSLYGNICETNISLKYNVLAVVCFGTIHNHKIPKVNLDKLIDSIDYLNKQKIDSRGSKYLDITDVLISSAQSGVNTGNNG